MIEHKWCERFEGWFYEDIRGCPRHMHWPRAYKFWDWVVHPWVHRGVAGLGFRNWLRWVLR